jgi:hypothetical protein
MNLVQTDVTQYIFLFEIEKYELWLFTIYMEIPVIPYGK